MKKDTWTFGLFFFSYAALLANAWTFAPALKTVYSGIYLYLVWLSLGLMVALPWMLILRARAEHLTEQSRHVIFLSFTLLQGVLAFAVAYWFFQTGLKGAFSYPAGALAAWLSFCLISRQSSLRLGGVLLAVFIALTFTISLRLQGIPGALSFGLAWLNSFILGSVLFKNKEEASGLWQKSAFWLAFLIVGRATIQQYLVESDYVNLGVVITHPYTYMALFIGLILPSLFKILMEEDILPASIFPTIAWIFLLGINFPLILGAFIHARPMAGFLLSFVSASFILGMLSNRSLNLLLFAYSTTLTVWFGLPAFKALSSMSRGVRLEILGVLFILTILGYFVLLRMKRSEQT